MTKGFFSKLIVALFAIGMLVSCSKSTKSAETDTSSDSVTITEMGKYSEDNPYHLVFCYVEFYSQDEAARQEVLDAINAKMIPEYHIEVELLPLQFADYLTTIQLMLSAGDELDVMPIYYPYASSWISMGGVYDMAELMSNPDGKKIIDALGKDNAFVGNMNGILYGFPANKESVELGGLAMRADICDELGITEKYGLKKNKDEYDGNALDWSAAGDIFATVHEAYPNMTPLFMSNTDQMVRMVFFDELVDGFGALDWEADSSSTKIVNKYETKTYRDAVMRMAQWYDNGYIYKDAATDTQSWQAMMKGGNTFSYLTAIKPGFLAEQQGAMGMDLYAMYFTNGKKEGGLSTTNVSFFNTSIASNSKDPEMAFKFISALYSDPELYNMWQYGIEGKHYTVLDDGTAFYPEGVDGTNYKYHQNTGWFMGNQFQSYVWNDGTKTSDYWSKLEHHNDWTEKSSAFGFMWDSSKYSTQITALNNAYETYRAYLNTGTVGVDDVDKVIGELNDSLYKAGLADVIKAKQAQLDAWLANK